MFTPEQLATNARTGFLPVSSIDELHKALTAGYGTDMSALTGGAALRLQSLDHTMQAVVQENEHFRLFNALPKRPATATVDEWTEQSGVGGFLGGSTNTETGVINAFTGSYARRTGMVRFLMTRREVSLVQSLQSTIIDSEAAEAANGALQLLTDAEYLCFEGDSTVVPTEFDGIHALVNGLGSTDHVLDNEAQPLNSMHLITKASSTIAGYGNYGRATDLFVSHLTQADLDNNIDPASRVSLTDVGKGGVEIGAPVTGVRTSWGNIKANPDVFIRDEQQMVPFEVNYSTIAAANTYAPASVSLAVASDAASKFTAAHDGNYYYAVAGITAAGQSVVTKSAQQAIAVGEKCTLTITASVGGAETGYVIYRSKLGGTNTTADFRECARVAKAGATTPWVDYNRDIPGCTKAYILNLSPASHAISWQQFLPMFKFPLYPQNSAVIPWAQLLFGYLRVTKRRQNVVIKNILPDGAAWRPFA